MDQNLRIYAWFLLVVTALPAAARLLRPRELANILLLRYQRSEAHASARASAATCSSRFLCLRCRLPSAHNVPSRRWLIMALLVGAVSSLEFVLDSRMFDEEPLARQNRYFGGVYASMAIANFLLLMTR